MDTSAPALETIETPGVPVGTSYHGIMVTEDYRWLEDYGSEQSRRWTRSHNRRTRGYLANLPFYDAVHRRAGEVLSAESVRYDAVGHAGSAYFAIKHQAQRQQPCLVMLSDLDDLAGGRILVDPDEIDASGRATIDWYQPSPDGSLVAVSLSWDGTRDGIVHVYRSASGELTGAAVPRVTGATAFGSLASGQEDGGAAAGSDQFRPASSATDRVGRELTPSRS